MSKTKKKAANEVVQADRKANSGERKAALITALDRITKDYGAGSVIRMGERPKNSISVISTGSLLIDQALGVGGLPRGRIVEIFGPESSGKTTLALHCIAEVQKAGGIAAIIDAEHALDPYYARKIGVDIDDLYVAQPDNGEQALDIAEALVRSGAIDIIVIDSVAALVPKAEIEGDMGDSHVGLQARLMSQALRKLAGVISKTNCCAIFINQLREKIGTPYGNPEVTTGGKALKFYASVRIDIRKGEPIKDGSEVVGSHAKVKIVKNKVAPPYRTAVVALHYGTGISKIEEIVHLGQSAEIIKKSGSFYSYEHNGTLLRAQGIDNYVALLKEHPDVVEELEKKIRESGMLKCDCGVCESSASEDYDDVGDEESGSGPDEFVLDDTDSPAAKADSDDYDDPDDIDALMDDAV